MRKFWQKGSAEPSPIYISTMTEGGLAKTTKAIQLKDELVEVNGVNVKVYSKTMAAIASTVPMLIHPCYEELSD